MKYAAVVLRNIKNRVSSVNFSAVTDAFLAGGVFLDEVVFLSYDAVSPLTSALTRLSAECDGVFVICDRALLSAARDAVSVFARKPLDNDHFLETNNCFYAVLPTGQAGAELTASGAIPIVERRRGSRYARVVLNAIDVSPKELGAALGAARAVSDEKLSIHAFEKFGCMRVEVLYNSLTPKMIADEVVRTLVDGLRDKIYAMEDVSIAQRLFDCLSVRKMVLSTAESFTGGGIGRAIVQIPGASAVFYEGLNTYDTRSKIERLGVSPATIKNKSVVSDDVAYEMAAGLLAQGNCDVAIATTGVAGPQQDSSKQPVGLCYIAVGTREFVRVFRYQLTGDRETNTETAINLALFQAYQAIK